MQRCVLEFACGAVMAALVSTSIAARADVASDKAAAILVFPKLLVDASNAPAGPRGQVDTLIRISNTSDATDLDALLLCRCHTAVPETSRRCGVA